MGNGDASNVGPLPLWLCDWLADCVMSQRESAGISPIAQPMNMPPLPVAPRRLVLSPPEKSRQYASLLAMRENLSQRYRSLTAQNRTREAAVAYAELNYATHKLMKWEGPKNV